MRYFYNNYLECNMNLNGGDYDDNEFINKQMALKKLGDNDPRFMFVEKSEKSIKTKIDKVDKKKGLFDKIQKIINIIIKTIEISGAIASIILPPIAPIASVISLVTYCLFTLYSDSIKSEEYKIVSKMIFEQLFDLLPELLKMNFFYEAIRSEIIEKTHKFDTDDSKEHIHKILNNKKKHLNKATHAMYEILYKIFYIPLDHIDPSLFDEDKKKELIIIIEKHFDFDKVIYKYENNILKPNNNIDNTFKFRFSTDMCRDYYINKYNITNTTDTTDTTNIDDSNSCDNINDSIVGIVYGQYTKLKQTTKSKNKFFKKIKKIFEMIKGDEEYSNIMRDFTLFMSLYTTALTKYLGHYLHFLREKGDNFIKDLFNKVKELQDDSLNNETNDLLNLIKHN